MNPAAAFADPLAATALARWVQSAWVFPFVEAAHIVSFALLIGAIAVIDVRLMGLLRHQPVAPLLRSALPVALVGFAGAVATGTLLFVANAGELLANRAFVIKMGLVMLAGLNAAWFHARGSIGKLDVTARAQTVLSLGLWLAVMICGRWIGYL